MLALEPHECLLDDSTKQVTCKPAQLVLTKLAGLTSHITVLEYSQYYKPCTSGYLSLTLLSPVLACLLLMPL